ncbi:MAG: rhodanese-like domain-containing protein [Thiolinea sp.]
MAEMHHLSPKAAYQYLQDNPGRSVLIDIRSSMEYLFVGHPIGSIHIAWIDEPDWDINPDFCKQVQDAVTRKCKDVDPLQDAAVVLCCRSGKRTLDAGAALLEAGFTQVMHIDEGFEGDRDENNHRSTLGGWRFHGLPWEQC